MKFGMTIMLLVKNEHIIFNHLHSVISKEAFIKIVRCNSDNAIAHDILRIQLNPA